MMDYDVVGFADMEAGEVYCSDCVTPGDVDDEDERFVPIFAGSEDAIGAVCAECHTPLLETL